MNARSSVLALAALVLLGVEPSRPAPSGVNQWRDDMEKADALLRAGKWKPGLRKAGRVAEEICATSWHDRDLKWMLAQLAFYRAVASANLGSRDEAAWSWYMAQNLDPRIRGTDFSPYGEAGKLLRELPLRRPGAVPPRFRIVAHDYGKYAKAELAEPWAPTLFTNPGAARERPGDVYVELIVDRQGRVHHPVVLTGGVHPVLVYGILEAMRTMPRLEPARYSGEAVDSLFKYTVSPDVSRWKEGGKKFTGELQ